MKKSFLILGFLISLLISCPPPTPEPGPDEGTSGNITVRFDPNGGSGSVIEIKGNLGDTFTFPECTATRQYYTFVGWDENKTTEDPQFKPGEKETIYQASGLTFYAIWQRTQIDITFQPSVPNGKPAVLKQDAGSFLSLPDGNDLFAVKENNRYFAGWSTTEGSSSFDGPGTPVQVGTTPLVFYACYESTEPEMKTLSLYSPDYETGLTIDNSSIRFNQYTKTIRLPSVVKRDNNATVTAEFLGWSETDNGTEPSAVKYTDGAVIENPFTTFTANYSTLYPVLKPKKSVRVSFDLNTAVNPNASWYSDPSAETVYYEGESVSFDTPNAGSREFSFIGWSYNNTIYSWNSPFVITDQTPAAITFTAVWKKPINVTWNLNGARMSDYAKMYLDDTNGNNVPDDLESAAPETEFTYGPELTTYFSKPPVNGKGYLFDGISVKTKSGKTVPVKMTEETFYEGEPYGLISYKTYTFSAPAEDIEMTLNWKETAPDAELIIIENGSYYILFKSFAFSVDTANFRLLTAENETIPVTYIRQPGASSIQTQKEMTAGTYRLQYLVDGKVIDEQTVAVTEKSTMEFDLGTPVIGINRYGTSYTVSVPVTYNTTYFNYQEAKLTMDGNLEIDAYFNFDSKTKLLKCDSVYGDPQPGDTLTLSVTAADTTKTVTFTIPEDQFRLYPSNESAQIALFRESTTSWVDIYIPIEKQFGTFYSFDVKATQNGSELSGVYSSTQETEDGLYSLYVYGSALTVGGTYTLTITPRDKTTPAVTCTVAIPADIQLRKKVMVSPL